MKNRNSSITKNPIPQTNYFYKNLQQKYQSFKSNCSSVKQSRARQFSTSSKISKNKKIQVKQTKQNKNQNIKNILYLQNGDQNLVDNVGKQYCFDGIVNNVVKLVGVIHNNIAVEKPKLVSICVSPLLSNSSIHKQQQKQTKTQIIIPYIQQLIRQFIKVTISIYSYTSSSKQQFYDMLSIRRQIKKDSKLLVQTNICNNSKSGIILKKLMEVAKQRQKIMNQQQLCIQVIVVKIKGNLHMDKQNGNENISLNQNGIKQVQMEISCGGFGEVGIRNLLGAEKLRLFFNILQVRNLQKFDQIEHKLTQYRSVQKIKCVNQNQLKSRIKILQTELQQKKKQLQYEKQRVAKQQEIQAQLDDIVLPSQRPMVSIQKYTKMNIGPKRPYFRNNKNQ